MAIVETSWQQFLEKDSEVPPDVFFLVKRDDEVAGNDSSRPIGAHRNFLAGVSPVFREELLKEPGEVIEVRDTTSEAFSTLIKFIYKPPPPASAPVSNRQHGWGFVAKQPRIKTNEFFPAPQMYERREYGFNDKEKALDQNRIRCPQKFFDLLLLAEKYQIWSMKKELISNALETLPITSDNVIFTARVASNYRKSFDDVSTTLLAKCLKFLLKKTSKVGDIWTRFWALVNDTEDPEEQFRDCLSFQEKLAGTPFTDLTISHTLIKESLDKVGHGSYEQCLYLACSGVHVRWTN